MGGPSDSPTTSVHVDLFRLHWLGDLAGEVFVERLPLDSPRLVTPDGLPTQLAKGWATSFSVSEPHTIEDCRYA